MSDTSTLVEPISSFFKLPTLSEPKEWCVESDDELELGASAHNISSHALVRKSLEGIRVVVASPREMDRLVLLRVGEQSGAE